MTALDLEIEHPPAITSVPGGVGIVLGAGADLVLEVQRDTVDVVSFADTTTLVLPESGPPGPAAGDTVELIAGAALSGHRAVTTDDTGKAVYASSGQPTHFNRPLFLTAHAHVLNEPADVVASGLVEESSWNWTPGVPIYLGTNGVLTQTPPATGFLRKVASVVDNHTVYFDPQPPIVLS